MIINSINTLMANNYKRSSKQKTQNFGGNTTLLNQPAQKQSATNTKFVSDKFPFLKNLFK